MSYVFANFLIAVATVLGSVLWFGQLIVIARAVITWVSPDPRNPIVRFLYSATEPVLYRIRATIPCIYGGIDFSPLILILGLVFLQAFLVQSLADLGASLRSPTTVRSSAPGLF